MEGYEVFMRNLDLDTNKTFNTNSTSLDVDNLQSGSLYDVTIYAYEDGVKLDPGSEVFEIFTSLFFFNKFKLKVLFYYYFRYT